MKKIFATVAVMMTLGSAYTQSNTEKNDTIVTDTTQTQPVEQTCMHRNDTVVTDTTKAEPVELAYIMSNDTVVTDTVKAQNPETPCEKTRENIIKALNATRKSEA